MANVNDIIIYLPTLNAAILPKMRIVFLGFAVIVGAYVAVQRGMDAVYKLQIYLVHGSIYYSKSSDSADTNVDRSAPLTDGAAPSSDLPNSN